MIIKLKILVIFFSLFVLFKSYAQNDCATEVTQSQKDLEAVLADSITELIFLNRTITITSYIVKSKSGAINFNLPDLNNAITELNTAFHPLKLHFQLTSIHYINNYHYDSLFINDNETALTTENRQVNTINLYLTKKLYDKSKNETSAFTYFPGQNKDVIILSKDRFNSKYLIEQVGHFFGLYHTHETTFGQELVNSSNCLSAGDLCCDTYADPNLNGKTSACAYTLGEVDSQGDTYVPSTANFMSASPVSCRCFFSDEQYIRMANYLVLKKSHLW